MQPRDTSTAHFWTSMVKSLARLGACGYLYYGDYVSAAFMFAAAEILGVAEEIV